MDKNNDHSPTADNADVVAGPAIAREHMWTQSKDRSR